MLFPILLIVVPAAILLACFAWARTDEDDTMRKIVVSCVQAMCLMSIFMGVMSLAQRSAAGPPPVEETVPVAAPSAPAPSKPVVVYTPGQYAADRKAAFAQVAETQRLAKERMENERLRREAEEAERQRPASETANVPPPAESGSVELEAPSEAPLPAENPPSAEGGDVSHSGPPAGGGPG